jgi:N-acetylneuraminic acid mutarotase
MVVFMGAAAWHVSAQASTPNTWTTVAPLPEDRMAPAAASADGRLYVFGGGGCATGFCRTFDAYRPSTNSWTSTGNMPVALGGLLSATTGPDGRIYLYGGHAHGPGATILVYDPRANTWTHAAPPPGVEDSALLVTGSDGRIYAVGGRKNGTSVGTVSAYSLTTHTWTAVRPIPLPGAWAAATLGPDGRIYVIGGTGTEVGQPGSPDRAEAYDPRTNSWSSVASLPTPRFELQAATGPDGRIYAIGGTGRCFTAPCNVVEAYDVKANTWTSVAPLPHPRWAFAATIGPDGRIYVLGGSKDITAFPLPLVTSVDAYTVVPAGQPLPTPQPGPTSVARELAPMPTGRFDLAAVTGHDGRIYAIGGQSAPALQAPPPGANTRILRTVEAYDPKTNSWSSVAGLPHPRWAVGAAVGPDGRIYVLGGIATPDTEQNSPPGLATVEIYNPKVHHWFVGGPMPDGRAGPAAVTGKDGRIYMIGGYTRCNPGDVEAKDLPQVRPADRPSQVGPGACNGTHVVRVYDPQTNTWKTLASLRVGRVMPAAVVAPDGRIFAIGGDAYYNNPLPSAEVYDPRANRWTPIAGMIHWPPGGFAAAMARDGRIYVIGGCIITSRRPGGISSYCGSPSPVDAYDPAHNTWKTIGSTLNVRQGLAATTGPDGRVYAVGGWGDGNGKLLEVIPPQ